MMEDAMKEDPKAERDDARIIELDVDGGDPRRPIHGRAKSSLKHETKLIDTRTGKEINLDSR